MSYIATREDALRATYPNRYDKNELRFSSYGTKEAVQKQGTDADNFINPEVENLISNSYGNASGVQVPVMNDRVVTVVNAPIDCSVPADNDGDADLITIATPVDFSYSFNITPTEHRYNSISEMAALNEKLKRLDKAMCESIDEQWINEIDTNKNQLFDSTITNYYPVISDALRVSQAEKDTVFNTVPAIMGEMDFLQGQNYDIIANLTSLPDVNFYKNQGANNSINTEFQYSPFEFWYDNTSRLTNNTGIQNTFYCVGSGSLKQIEQVPPEFTNGTYIGSVESPSKAWGMMEMPQAGINMGVLFQQNCDDKSAKGGGTFGADLVKSWSFYIRIYFLTVYNSDAATRYNPILKFEIES